MSGQVQKIQPLVLCHGKTYSLSRKEWLLVYALAGFNWAVCALEKLDIESNLGAGI